MPYTHRNPSERNVIERMKQLGSCQVEISRALAMEVDTTRIGQRAVRVFLFDAPGGG